MKYILIINDKNIAITKAINHTDNSYDNEVEITQEQYNQIEEFPLKLTIEDGRVISWEKTTIEPTPVEEPLREPTVEDRLTAVEDVILNLL